MFTTGTGPTGRGRLGRDRTYRKGETSSGEFYDIRAKVVPIPSWTRIGLYSKERVKQRPIVVPAI